MTATSVAAIILLISWLPVTGASQLIVYTMPPAILVLASAAGIFRLSKSDFIFLLIGTALAFGIAAMHTQTGLINPTLGLLTYSSLGILAVRFRTDTERLLRMVIHALAWLSIIECFVGVLQLLFKQNAFVFSQLSSGDVVKGTLGGAHSHLYAIKMLFQGLVLLWMYQHARAYNIRYVKPRLVLFGAAAAFAGGVFASFISGTVLFAAGVIGHWLFRRLQRPSKTTYAALRRMMAGATVTALLVGLFCYTQPGNARLLVGQGRQIATQGFSDEIRYQKIHAFNASISQVLLDNPVNSTVGIGLGRYSSRAAMILSGGYLRDHPSWIPISRSPETTRQIYLLWNPYRWERFGGSIMGMPTSSAQSVLIEFGLLGAGALAWYFVTLARRARQRWLGAPHLHATLQGGMLRLVPVMLSALVAVSFSDVWLEYASVTTVVYLLVIIALSHNTNPATPAVASEQDQPAAAPTNPMLISPA